MTAQIFSLSVENKIISQLKKVSVAELGLHEVSDVESWLASSKNPLFDRKILWIARQDVGSDDQRSDLVGIADNGDLVVVELKRGMAQPDALIQVLRYAADYKSKTVDELAAIYQNCSTRKIVHGLIVCAESLDDANKKIGDHVSDNGVNQSQICIVVAESFDDKILSICDYIEESNGEATFSIELWQYGVYQDEEKKDEEKKAQHFFVLEQIAPPLTTRDRIEAERENAKSKKWARETVRASFMSSLVDKLKPTAFPLQRVRGETYSGVIKVAGNEIVFQFRRTDKHPQLKIPKQLVHSNSIGEKLPDGCEIETDEGDNLFIKFTKVSPNNSVDNEEFCKQLTSILEFLARSANA